MKRKIKFDRGISFVREAYAKEHALGLKARGYKVKRKGNRVYSSIEKVI